MRVMAKATAMALRGRSCTGAESLTVEFLSVAQDLLNTLCHDLMHFRELLIQHRQIPLRPGIDVEFLCLLDEGI